MITNSNEKQSIADKPYMSIAETADYLGVSAKTIQRLIITKDFPCYRLSARKILIRPKEVDEYISKHRI